jgi:glycosyltransferase involved in cell wall biosynthesis
MLDISRLVWSARRAGPSGIDRVELAYAQHFLGPESRRPAFAVVHLMGWIFAIGPAAARRFIESISARWQGSDSAAGRAPGILSVYATLLSGHWMAGFQLRRRLKRLAKPSIFLVVSHHHLSLDYTMRRIRRSFGARCVCFLHDLIPIEYPEYVQPNRQRRHELATQTITRLFDAVIVNSKATEDGFREYLLTEFEQPARVPEIHVALPGVRAFPARADALRTAAGSAAAPYFVVLGTIEPKKNHLMLLNLWTRLAAATPNPPRLIVIGARGWENEQVVDMLDRSRRLHGLVEERNHMDDAAIGAVLGQARALLMPSFTEGFGLPVAEALASGVPVICSDIPAFREVGREVPEYLDPLDLFGWRAAVIEYSRADSERRNAQLERMARWQAPRWSDHFEIVENALDEVAHSAGIPG